MARLLGLTSPPVVLEPPSILASPPRPLSPGSPARLVSGAAATTCCLQPRHGVLKAVSPAGAASPAAPSQHRRLLLSPSCRVASPRCRRFVSLLASHRSATMAAAIKVRSYQRGQGHRQLPLGRRARLP
ncbi:hypothetical protein ZWY2020_041014 [Hordeum vulgare]|nr:hypothetical protein ZWY2020_041014 [Hordeum vulgare]